MLKPIKLFILTRRLNSHLFWKPTSAAETGIPIIGSAFQNLEILLTGVNRKTPQDSKGCSSENHIYRSNE
jgi:hypothetical protein